MKKIYVVLGLVVAALAAVAAVIFGQSFQRNNYASDYARHLSAAVQKGTLAAEYAGETHPLGDQDVDGVLRVLTRGASDMKAVRGAPEKYDEKMTLYADDLTLTLYKADQKKDSVVIEREIGGKRAYYQLDGYAMFKWLLDAAGFQQGLT